MYELYRKQEKGGCQLQIFPFPQKYWIGFQFCGGGRGRGGGVRCPCPKCLLIKQGKYIHLLYFFFRWLFLISITPVTHTAKSPCSTVYLFHFVPVIHVTFVFNFFLILFFNVQSKGYLPLKIDLCISFILTVLRESVPLYSQGRSLFCGSTSL